ncbi:MAG: acyl-ACP--UDP-N-acetylglucosamine O-acyltransferase [bacterium]
MAIHIDSHAAVSPKATISDGVRIGPFSVIQDDVIIGEGTWIGSNVEVSNGTRIGREGKIHHGAAIGGPPQDLKYKGEPTTLEIGDHVVAREYVTLNRGTSETGKTTIGNDCLFMAYAHVAHDCRVGNNVIMANCCALGGHVTLGNWVIIGGMTPVHQFGKVGDHVMLAGGFRAVKDVPPFILAGQEPLVFEGLNIIGLRRRGFSPKAIEIIDKAYYLIYQSNLNVSQAVARIKEEVELIPEVQSILDFIAQSKRGIIPALRHRS